MIVLSKAMLEDLQPEARLTLEAVLYDDEELLWVAPPVCRVDLCRSVGRFFFCIAFLLAIGCIALLFIRYPQEIDHKRINLLIPLAGFCVLALVLWQTCRLVMWRMSKTLYAVTDTRAVIIAPPYFGHPQASCYPINKNLVKKVIIRAESGDIIFEGDGVRVPRTGFISCPQAREVYRCISERAERLSSADAQD